ncbi:MAG: hypothetical protein M0Q92_13150 [Methanoregula sp.]|jgi:hypothetical protein|nr:hypothetical protein [Methanoregula sp.]
MIIAIVIIAVVNWFVSMPVLQKGQAYDGAIQSLMVVPIIDTLKPVMLEELRS